MKNLGIWIGIISARSNRSIAQLNKAAVLSSVVKSICRLSLARANPSNRYNSKGVEGVSTSRSAIYTVGALSSDAVVADGLSYEERLLSVTRKNLERRRIARAYNSMIADDRAALNKRPRLTDQERAVLMFFVVEVFKYCAVPKIGTTNVINVGSTAKSKPLSLANRLALVN